jgi:peptidoglycan hydrolase-like protein with peptidoglycan-binding domain
VSTIAGFYTQGARSAGGHFGADRGNGRKHRGQDFSHSRNPGTIGVPALLGGTIISKTAPSKSHGFGYGVTERASFEGEEYDISYSHGPWASQNSGAVSQGAILLHEGNSGATSGSCVHVEVFRRRTGTFIDPWPFIQRVLASVGRGSAPAANQVTKDRQNWLNVVRGEKLAVDGIEGPATRDAYRRYQAFLGIGQDGKWGPITQAAHQRYADARSQQIAVDGSWGAATTKALQRTLGVAQDGVLGPQTYRALQSRIGTTADGAWGPNSKRALQRHLGVAQDGVVGPATVRALQQRLNAGNF